MCPAATVYVKVRLDVPLPLAYDTTASEAPVSSVNCGEPVTFTVSEKDT